jgi:hypothetical protein
MENWPLGGEVTQIIVVSSKRLCCDVAAELRAVEMDAFHGGVPSPLWNKTSK